MTAVVAQTDAVMRTAVLVGPMAIEIQERPAPRPASDQVRVRLEGCGVCGSNLVPWQGRPWLQYPHEAGAPGHEGWGTVDSIGSDVDRGLLGRRVALLSYRAFAEYDVAAGDRVVLLPEALDGQPCPAEALGCAMNIFHRSGIRSGDHVAIVGAGFLGVLLVELATRAGAKVIAISRRTFARELAERAGAVELVPMHDHREIIDRVMTITGGRGCVVTIECVGEQWPLDLAAELTAERGRLVIAGYHQDPRQVNMQLWNWRGLDVVNAHERSPESYLQGMREAVAAIASGSLHPAPLYTHRFPLSELGTALRGLEERPDGMLKTCVGL
jgi:NADPH:quinone reductase